MRTVRTIATSAVFWLVVAVAVLLVNLVEVGYQGQLTTWRAGLRSCQTVTRPAAIDSAQRDVDIAASNADTAQFAEAAAAARRREPGFRATAVKYAHISKRSKARALRAQVRARRSLARARVPCTTRWPKPQRHFLGL